MFCWVLMVDVGYAFADTDSCLATIREWQEFDLFFVETPLPSGVIAWYARLAHEQPIPIAAGEWLATRHEFRDLMDDGLVAIAQPDIGRVDGLTEANRVCDIAAARAAHRAARMEDRAVHRRRDAPGGGDPPLPLYRVPAGRHVRIGPAS